MNQIFFHLGEETRHRIETINNDTIESSLFSDQYKKTLSVLNERFTFMTQTPDNGSDKTNPLNNIISFIGDRGSGKTSCMMSIANLLNEGSKSFIQHSYGSLAKYSFYCVDMIDPAFFDDNHNVIELFLANLLRAYQDIKRKKDAAEVMKKKILIYLQNSLVPKRLCQK